MPKKDPDQNQLNALVLMFNQKEFQRALDNAKKLLKTYKKSLLLNKIAGFCTSELGQHDSALFYFKRMAKIDPKSAEAYFFIASILTVKQQLDDAIKNLQLAFDLDPSFFQAAYNLGCKLIEVQKPERAIKPLEVAVNLEPENLPAKVNLGIALFRSGALRDADHVLTELIDTHPESFEACLNLGLVKLDIGELHEAIQAFEAAERIRPKVPQTSYGLGVAYKSLDKHHEARKYLKIAIDNGGAFEAAMLQLAGLELDEGNLQESQVLLEKILLVNSNNHKAKIRLAENYRKQRHHNLAIQILGSIPTKASESYVAKRILAQIYFEIHRYNEALSLYESFVADEPKDWETLYNIGLILSRMGQSHEALLTFEQAFIINPKSDVVTSRLIYQQKINCDWKDTDLALSRLESLGIKDDAISPFIALSFEDNPKRQQLRSINYARHSLGKSQKQLQRKHASDPQRIRVGYFSGDFYDHPLLDLFQGVLREHNKEKFDVRVYSYGPVKTGQSRALAQKNVESFLDVESWTDQGILDHLAANPLDIAVDLSGYTEFSRTEILAARVAPVQISHLGFPSTTGADFIDYLIADKTLVTTETRDFYTEKLIFMPNSFQPNDIKRSVISEPTTRAQNNLPDDGIVFCCFHNSYKISENVFDIWLRVIGCIDESVLWLSDLNSAAALNLKARATSKGIDPDRLIFAPKLAKHQHLERLQHADLFLDTFNVNAGANASDALWSGVPVLTKIGNQFAARMAASLNKNTGLSQLITETADAYEALAIELGSDPDLLKSWKNHLIENRFNFPLFDTVAYTADFEVALQKAHEQRTFGSSLSDIVIRN